MIKQINKNQGQVLIIGDLHGMYDLLIEKMNSINFNYDTDIVVSVGDVIDRGNKSPESIDLFSKPWFHSVLGNHEEIAYYAIRQENNSWFKEMWIENGGSWYYENEDPIIKEKILRLIDLPLLIELDVFMKKVIITHANYSDIIYPPNIELDITRTIWDRNEVRNLKSGVDARAVHGADLVVHGHNRLHTPTRSNNKLFLDTGSGYEGGFLSALLKNKETVFEEPFYKII